MCIYQLGGKVRSVLNRQTTNMDGLSEVSLTVSNLLNVRCLLGKIPLLLCFRAGDLKIKSFSFF